MPRNAPYRPRVFASTLFVSLFAMAAAAPGWCAEPAPTYQLAWSVVPIGGSRAVPLGIALDATGNVYVTQRALQLVMSFTPTGTYRFAWELTPLGCIPLPFSIGLDASGNAFVLDYACSRVEKFDSNRALVGVFGGAGSGDGKLSFPYGLAVGPDGSVYVADTFNHRIQKFDANGNFLLKWGSFGSEGGQFNMPSDVAIDAAGNVYVLDSFNQRVQVFNGVGTLLRVFGEPGFGSDHLIQPMGLAVDPSGNVYVADTGNHQVVKFSSSGERLVAWGGLGSGPGQMIAPNDVAVDGAGNVYVVDSGNKRIQKFASPLVASLHVEPRTLNTHSGGKWVVASIEPPSPYVPGDIDVGSLLLNGVAADPAAPVTVTDVDADGVLELSVRFSRAAVAATAVPGTDDLTLSLVGTMAGRGFVAHDVIKVLGNGDISIYDPGLTAAQGGSGEDRGPSGSRRVFEMRSVTPNPVKAGASLAVWFQLPRDEPGRLEVIDLTGRRVSTTEVAPTGSGLRSAKVVLQRSLTPGVYLIRLSQRELATTAKFALIE